MTHNPQSAAQSRVQCPLCNGESVPDQMIKGHDLDETVAGLIQGNEPQWRPDQRICINCATKYVEARNKLEKYHPKFLAEGLAILPTPLRVGAVPELTGRGITIAFLDSGFYAHPDLTQPASRIKKYVNILDPKARINELNTPGVSSWHGMMTSVVAAGNGQLSDGIYKGIASEAELVLIKIGDASRIKHEDIERGLKWVLKNKDKFNIRIVNISAGGDREESYLTDPLSRAAEDLIRAGVVVVAAAGNSGDKPHHPVLPPASAPSVIAVGGLDDKNRLDRRVHSLYRSSYGPTIDGLQKPEILAPSIWLAAPILPGTQTQEEAAFFEDLKDAEDDQIKTVLHENMGMDKELDAMIGQPVYLIRQMVDIKLRNNNLISEHYKHVDGTSFAAPIITSIVAQMLEANPTLTPQKIKHILIDTAKRLPAIEVDRQGWGVVNPAAAVKLATHFEKINNQELINAIEHLTCRVFPHSQEPAMLKVKKQNADLATLPNRSNSELLFPGGKFELEKRTFPLILSANYAILALVILFNAPFSIESICWTVVISSLSAGILTKVRGRWLALMIFSVPVLLKILETGMGRIDWMVLWIVSLISLSAAYSSFNVVSGFAKWLKSRQKANS